eukprot:g12585.t1
MRVVKQVLYQQGQTFVEDVPAPRVEPGGLLVRVDHSAISVGTEMHGIRTSAVPLWKRALKNPQLLKRAYQFAKNQGVGNTRRLLQEKANAVLPLGYSTAGTVLETGAGVEEFQPGDRVACAGNQNAYHAEIIYAPSNLTVAVPDNVELADASTVALGAIALQGVRRLEPTLGETFVVVGLGFLGQLIAQLLRAHGCRAIGVDVDRMRLALAEELGMSAGLHPDDEFDYEQVIRLTGGTGADGAIVAAATPSDSVIAHAFKMCRRKGRVVLVGDVGLGINRNDMYQKELDFRISTSYGPGRYDDDYEQHGIDYPIGYVRWTENRNMAEYLRLLAEGSVRVGPLISTVVPIDAAAETYEQIRSGAQKPLMALLRYPAADAPAETTPKPATSIHYTATQFATGEVGLAIVGPGSFTRKMHLPNLEKLTNRYNVRAVVARSGHNAALIAKRCGAALATTDFDAVLADDSVDALLIGTRHDQHAEMTLRALQAGKHVLVEKPLALTQEELSSIAAFYETHSDSPPVLLTGFNRRFAPMIAQVGAIVKRRSNPLIANYIMNAGYIPSDHWVHGPEGGGRNRGEACHIYDLFTALTGSRVESVSATAVAPATEHYRLDDNFTTTLRFADGSIATLTYTAMGNQQSSKERLQLFVDGKIIEMDDYRRLTATGLPKPIDTGKRGPRSPEKGHFEELVAFADVIQNGGEWPIPMWQQIQATEISFALGLGHRRLAIIDLSDAAAQPMSNSGKTLHLTFNGEIYNHAEIREELQSLGHHDWQTDHSDTEVILHAFEEWGIECVHRFRGMFAFAIWDARARELWLARDRVGIKPLYYSRHHGRLVFASEIKALLNDPDQHRGVDEEALFHYLSFLTTPAPMTLFDGIRKLPPATWMRVRANGDTIQQRYWDVWDHTEPLENASEEEIAERVLEELRSAVKYRTVGDVPVGVFLSGGIDSSTNAALFSEDSQLPLRTFTIGYDDSCLSNPSEVPFAREVARQFNADGHEHLLTQNDLLRFLPEMIHLQDEPIADPVCVPVYYVSKLARDNGVTVCQVGEGADELFCGYPGWLRTLRLQKGLNLPLGGLAARLGRFGLSQTGRGESWPAEKLRRVAEGLPIFWGGAEAFPEIEKRSLLSSRLRSRFAATNTYGLLKRFRFIREFLAETSPKSVLDVGCGTGNNLTVPLAKEFPHIRFVAADADRASIEFAQANNTSENLSFRLTDDVSAHEKFDVVIASEVIEHVEDPKDFLKFLGSRLAPGGRVVLTLPNGYGPFELGSFCQTVLQLTGLLRILLWVKRAIFGQRKPAEDAVAGAVAPKGHDTLAVFAGDFAAKMLLGLAGLALIRFMPDVEYAVLTVATVLSAFVVQGMTGNLNRVYLVGRKQLGLEDAPQNFLAMQLWMVAAIALAGLPIVWYSPSIAGVYWLIVAVTVANCLLEFAKTFYQQELRFVRFSLIEFARTLVFVLALVGLIVFQAGEVQAWQVLALNAGCVIAVVLIVFGRQLEAQALLRVREVWRLSRQVLASRYLLMIGYFFGVAMLVRVDVLMLSLLDSDIELATFGASFRYYSILMMLLGALHTVFLPLTQRVKTRDELSILFGQHRRLIALIVPMIVVGAWTSAWIIPAIDGGKYPGAVDVFRVLSLSAVISLACSPHANLLLRYGAFRFLFAICVVAIAGNVVMNALWIPRWHAVGAAWATLFAAGGVNVMILFRSRALLASQPIPDQSPVGVPADSNETVPPETQPSEPLHATDADPAAADTRSAGEIGPLKTCLAELNVADLQAVADESARGALSALCERYQRHEFNLLGSGWVNVRHGIACAGLNGHRFPAAADVAVDKDGTWLTGRLSEPNLARSRTIWKQVDDGYMPIDWQLDFKSGYRWSESTWYRDIPLGHLSGVDIKVPWELARMQHLPQMALAACLDESVRTRFAREYRNEVLDFVATNPPRFGVNWNCAMDVGIRVANWLLARALFVAAGVEFDRDFEQTLAAAVYDHAEHIAANLEWSPGFRGNHYLADIAGLLFAAAYLPSHNMTNAWLAFAVRQLVTEVKTQFFADGGNFEASTCYHRLSAEMVVWCTALVLGLPEDKQAALAEYDHTLLKTTPRLEPAPVPLFAGAGNGLQSSPFPPWYFDRVKRMTEFVQHTTKPNGRLHQLGDNDSGRFFNLLPTLVETRDDTLCEDQLNPRALVAAASGLIDLERCDEAHSLETSIVAALCRQDVRTVETKSSRRPQSVPAGEGRGGFPEDYFSTQPQRRFSIRLPDDSVWRSVEHMAYPDFGVYIWRTPRCYLAIRCGTIGQNGIGGHAHNDQLSLELQVDGQDWIADAGTFLYTPHPDTRNRYRSVAAHFAPRLKPHREPGRLDRGLFRIDGTAGGECLYAGRDGFIGRHTSYGPAVTRVLRFEDMRIVVEDHAEGGLELHPVADIAIDALPEPGVPFSSGYGIAT